MASVTATIGGDYGANASVRSASAPQYIDDVVRAGVVATVFWGVVGFLVGVVVALQLAYPDLNIEPWLNFGRLRPLHTSAVIFAFGGNALIATSFYVVQRTSRQRLFGVQIPLALPTILAGVNQTTMMALSMVVIASMIGAGGLGYQVLQGIGRLEVSRGLFAGLGIVALAIVFDRITQAFGRQLQARIGLQEAR